MSTHPDFVHEVRAGEGTPRWVHAVDWSPDGTLLAAACADGFVRMYSTTDWSEKMAVEAHSTSARGVAFVSDTLLASCGSDGRVVFYDTGAAEVITAVAVAQQTLLSLHRLDDGERVVVGGHDGTFVVSRDGVLIRHPAVPSSVWSLDISDDQEFMVFGGHDGYVFRRTVADGVDAWRSQRIRGPVASICLVPGRDLVVAGGTDAVFLLDSNTGNIVTELKQWNSGSVKGLDLLSDTQFVTGADVGGAVQVWRTDGTAPMSSFRAHLHGIHDLVLSPDRKHYATASRDGTVRIWTSPSLAPESDDEEH